MLTHFQDNHPGSRAIDEDGNRLMEITDLQGRILERRVYTGEVLRKKTNFDAAGLPIRIEEYDEAGRLLLSREADADSKKLNLTWRYDAEESAVQAEKDRNGDGQADIWYFYKDGRIMRVEEDRNRDGKPDLWETYDTASTLVRRDEDIDFDGAADIEKQF